MTAASAPAERFSAWRLVFFASALAAYVSGILAALTGMPRPADPHEKDIDAAWYAPSHADDARGADL